MFLTYAYEITDSFLWTAKLANKTKKPALAVAKCSKLMTVRWTVHVYVQYSEQKT